MGLVGCCRSFGGSLSGGFLGHSGHGGRGQDGENRQDGGRTRGGAASLGSSQRASHVEKGDAHGRSSLSTYPSDDQSYSKYRENTGICAREFSRSLEEIFPGIEARSEDIETISRRDPERHGNLSAIFQRRNDASTTDHKQCFQRHLRVSDENERAVEDKEDGN